MVLLKCHNYQKFTIYWHVAILTLIALHGEKLMGMENESLYAKHNIDQKDTEGRTALHRATINGDVEEVAQLLANNACYDIKDIYGKTALDYAKASTPAIKAHFEQKQNGNKIGKEKVTIQQSTDSKGTIIYLGKGSSYHENASGQPDEQKYSQRPKKKESKRKEQELAISQGERSSGRIMVLGAQSTYTTTTTIAIEAPSTSSNTGNISTPPQSDNTVKELLLGSMATLIASAVISYAFLRLKK